jgi:hypothetical protein
MQGSVRTGRVRHSGSHEASWQHFPGILDPGAVH